MATLTKTTLATVSGKIGTDPYYRQRVYTTETKVTPSKNNGQWIDLGGGHKFRASTTRELCQSQMLLDGPEIRSGTSISGLKYNVVSTPGGYYSDSIIAPATGTTITGGTGCLQRFNIPPVIGTLMGNEAKTKALLKIADQKAAIGENLATARQTINLIQNPAWTLIGLLKAMRNDDLLRPWLYHSYRQLNRMGVEKFIAKRYLEYVYGMKPLVNDIYGIIELAKKDTAKPLLLTGLGSSSQSAQFQKVYSPGETRLTAIEEATVRCKVVGRIDPNYAGIRALNQLGLLNPISLTWELIPWSFVVDWFVPIGPVLQALTAPAGLIFVDGSISSKVKAYGEFTHDDKSYPNNAISSEQLATGRVVYSGYSRSRLIGWPLPGFYYSREPLGGKDSDRPLKALGLAISNLRSNR